MKRRVGAAAALSVPIRRESPERVLKQYDLLIKFFVASESFFFLAMIISYMYYRGIDEVIATGSAALDATKTGSYTALLVLSSGTLWWGHRQLKRQKPKLLAVGLASTIILGVVFLYGQGTEYAHLLREDITIDRNIFGSAFFTLTGFHALHVAAGLIILSIVLALTLLGDFTGPRSDAVASIELYWHFVDVVWLIVFFVVYILPLL